MSSSAAYGVRKIPCKPIIGYDYSHEQKTLQIPDIRSRRHSHLGGARARSASDRLERRPLMSPVNRRKSRAPGPCVDPGRMGPWAQSPGACIATAVGFMTDGVSSLAVNSDGLDDR